MYTTFTLSRVRPNFKAQVAAMHGFVSESTEKKVNNNNTKYIVTVYLVAPLVIKNTS